VDAVQQQRGHLQLRQVAGQQVLQRLAGLGNEPARDRRLRRRAGGLLDGSADGLGCLGVTAGRQPGQHPLQDHLAGQVVVGQQLPGGELDS
jgi:hypothetical protein